MQHRIQVVMHLPGNVLVLVLVSDGIVLLTSLQNTHTATIMQQKLPHTVQISDYEIAHFDQAPIHYMMQKCNNTRHARDEEAGNL